MDSTYALLGKYLLVKTILLELWGIINISPESFYKKLVKISEKGIVLTVETMINSGVDIIDVGARTSAPYLNTYLPLDEKMNRALRAIKTIKDSFNIPISIDTISSKVAEAALKNDVEIVNDVSGLKADSDMSKVVADYNASLVIVVRINDTKPLRSDVINCTIQVLKESLSMAYNAGIQPKKIVIDPGIGFPSSLQAFTKRGVKRS